MYQTGKRGGGETEGRENSLLIWKQFSPTNIRTWYQLKNRSTHPHPLLSHPSSFPAADVLICILHLLIYILLPFVALSYCFEGCWLDGNSVRRDPDRSWHLLIFTSYIREYRVCNIRISCVIGCNRDALKHWMEILFRNWFVLIFLAGHRLDRTCSAIIIIITLDF